MHSFTQGGMPGSVRLRDCEILRRITSKQAEEKRLYSAICAAPAVTLLPWGLLKKKKVSGIDLELLYFNAFYIFMCTMLANCDLVCRAR